MEGPAEDEKFKGFHEMDLDDRILKAIARLRWIEPTLIQERAIPLILEGKNILIRARTGSGKTAAFAIPIIQKLLTVKPMSLDQVIRTLILAPTKELCQQIFTNFKELTVKCSREVTCIDISQHYELSAQRPLLIEGPDVVIATPARALAHLKAKNMNLKESLQMLVVDEADLLFSFGFEDDIKQLLSYLPKAYQAVLASATLTEEVLNLKQLTLHNPVILKLNEPELAPTTQLSHYHLYAEEEDKAVILLKLYLEQFGIPSCVLNSELPASMRCHSVNQFNSGIYDLIIASDENLVDDPAVSGPKKGGRKRDKESGVIRGIDFQHVSNVINFDFPRNITSYIHRAGRTARGNNEGTALSFVSNKERPLLEEIENHLKECFESDPNQLVIRAYEFKMDEVEGFRYRSRDAWRAVTKIAIREARLKEIRQEILNNNKLKSYFQDNPRDLQCLRHDKALHTVKQQPHLANVPEYIIPQSLKGLNIASALKRKRPKAVVSKSKSKYLARQEDPLVCLKFGGLNKKKRK
ncbi:hypothetical protein RUM44_000500 [Polyplax serrata]|uniref:RNA helicase n=1 Tax=Polyplax serrata TaxID=468196 RepID=A0ABR1B5R7_POLSC